MKKIILLLMICSAFATLSEAGSVIAEVSQHEVIAGNMVQLRIKAKGKRAEFPVISEIDGVQVQGRSQTQSNAISYINGKMSNEHSTTLILTFAPEHNMTIPSYTVTIDGQAYKTKPIAITVVKASSPSVGSHVKYALQMRADKQEVMVGEPVLVTVYFTLQTGVRLADNPQYSKPEFKGFFVKEINDPRAYIKGDKQIQELRYILTPQKEGTYTIAPARATITEVDRSRRDMFGSFFGGNARTIASNSLTITVKPKPVDTDLVGSFTLESHLDHNETKANKPVNLIVHIEGEGSLEDFDLSDYEIDGVTVYSDEPKVESRLMGEKLHSTFVKSFAFISDHDFTIPSRTISVYDIKQAKVLKLKIPSYTVKVKASAYSTVTSKEDAIAGKVQTNLKQPEDASRETTVAKRVEVVRVDWWMLVFAFMAGAVTLFLLQRFPKLIQRSPRPFKESEALKLLYAHINEDKEAEAMVRKLYARKHGDKDVVIDKKELKALVEKYRSH